MRYNIEVRTCPSVSHHSTFEAVNFNWAITVGKNIAKNCGGYQFILTDENNKNVKFSLTHDKVYAEW